ncbi:copia protein [Tanacetum coccineum]|uniref:Copia protein n=1 Tax=Tanacetum coccineum TaxID=301880 RepID=A0ABQ5IGX6_9ASTR
MFKEGNFDDDFDDADDILNEEMENVEGDTVNASGAVNTATTGVSAASASVTTAGVSISTAEPRTPPTTTKTTFKDEDLTISQTLVKMRTSKEPKKGSDLDGCRLAMRLQEEEKAELKRMQRERTAQEEASNAALIVEFNDVQARMDADALLAVRLQEEEREQFSIDEKARFLVETIAKRKRFFAAQWANQIRNKTPTKTQLRNRMITFLKNIDSGKKDDDSQKQVESSKKRPRAKHDEESVKKQKLKDDAEKEELRACMDIIPCDDIAVNVESLATKYLIIDWKTHIITENMMYYQIIRVDGNSKNYKIFSEMLDDFDRQDVVDLYSLVKERYEIISLESYDRLLWGDLITLFESSEEDELWKGQQDYKLISWRLFDSCGVHVLLMDTGVAIHMMKGSIDSKIVKAKGERISLALKAKKKSSDEECSTSRSEDEEYAPWRCGDPNHLIRECPKPLRDKNQRAFVGGSWSDNGEEEDEMIKDETCLICLGVNLEPDEWIKDSRCSKHMMGNRKLFSSYKAYNGGNVIFGSNLHGNIISKGKICDNKCRVTFSEHDSEITKDGKVIGRGIRKKGLYVMKLGNKPNDKICLATIDENSTLWHRRLGQANMRLIQSLASKELVRNLPKLKFDQYFCDACKIRKQAHASHKAKNLVLTTRCLELIHMDIFGPSAVRSYRGNRYTLAIVDNYSRKIKESLNVTFEETPLQSKTSPLVNDYLHEEEAIKVTEKKNLEKDIEDETLEIDEIVKHKECFYTLLSLKNQPLEFDIGKPSPRNLRIWYPKGTGIETVVYADSDHAGDYKQTALAISTTEAEYVRAGMACQQALWMKQALIDYDVRLDDIPIMYDNKGAIDLGKNPMQHSRTKHIKICPHFLRNNVQKGHISIEKVSSVDNIADILTKPLKYESFNYLHLGLGMMKHIP